MPPIIVPLVKKVSSRLVNASLSARPKLSFPTILVSIVIPTAKPATEPLSTNVNHVPKVFLFSILDVAYRRVIKPSSSPRTLARTATQVARAASVLGLVVVWHVRALPHLLWQMELVSLLHNLVLHHDSSNLHTQDVIIPVCLLIKSLP